MKLLEGPDRVLIPELIDNDLTLGDLIYDRTWKWKWVYVNDSWRFRLTLVQELKRSFQARWSKTYAVHTNAKTPYKAANPVEPGTFVYFDLGEDVSAL